MISRKQLLLVERAGVQRWLDTFDCSRRPYVAIEPSGQTLSISNFPLPDGFEPDRIDLAMVVTGFPEDPPKGLYLLRRPDNGAVIGRLQQQFNVFRGQGYHGAPSIAGFEWLCIGYLDGWRYDTQRPHKGDNIAKMLGEFWRQLEECSA